VLAEYERTRLFGVGATFADMLEIRRLTADTFGDAFELVDLRYNVAMRDRNLCNVVPDQGDTGVLGALNLIPGDPMKSTLWTRMNSLETKVRMPEIASAIVDAQGTKLIADWITSIAGTDPHLIMLLMVLLFTIIGDFIEPVPTIIIFMPLVNALTQAGDINGVHMGVVLIATLAFGLITPPYGLVLLMASKFVGVSFGKALRAALPIYVVFLVTICFTIYFPKVVLWLPKQVIPESVGCFKSPAGTGYICP